MYNIIKKMLSTEIKTLKVGCRERWTLSVVVIKDMHKQCLTCQFTSFIFDNIYFLLRSGPVAIAVCVEAAFIRI